MRSINSLSIYNPLEEKILASVPSSARHVAVVGDGDGRLARAIREKLGSGVRIFVAEHRAVLRKYLDDFEDVLANPWDVGSFEAEVQKHGAFDLMIFYGMHEYWSGQVRLFQRLLGFSRPNGVLWVTFINSSALRLIEKELPPLRLSADALASPYRRWGRMDYASWMAGGSMFNTRIDSVWGLFDHASFQYCENPAASGSADWDIRGLKIHARTPAEVVHWGAAYVGIQMTVQPDSSPAESVQALGGAAFTPHLYQSLVDPFPEAGSDEPELAWAEAELRTLRGNRDSLRPSQMVEFVLGLVEDAESARDVLVLGAGWGRDVYMIRKARPQWSCSGVEPVKELVAMGDEFRREEGIRVEPVTLGENLPFPDKSFDFVFSLGFMSRLYDQAALALVKEVLRVGRRTVYHLEDQRGPDESVKLKINSLPAIYSGLGRTAEPRPVLVKGQDTGLAFFQVTI